MLLTSFYCRESVAPFDRKLDNCASESLLSQVIRCQNITLFNNHGIQIPCSISSKDKFYLRVSRYLDVINLRYAFLEPNLVTFDSTSNISYTYCPEIRFLGITFYLYDVITLLWLEGLFFLPLCAGCASNVCHPFRVTKPSDSNFLWHN